MSLENQVARVSQGAKDTLKALINMMGGNITDELIDQYPAIASQLLPPTGITGNTVTVTAKEQLDAGNMIIILQNGDGYDAYKATTEGVATSNFWLGIAKDTVLADATADVISIAYMEASSDFVVEQNKGNEQKFWVGTKEEYRAIEAKDPNTLYILTDEEGSATSYVTQGEFIALSQAVDNKADLVDGKVPTEQLPKANGLYMPDGTTTIKEAFDTKADADTIYTKTESDELLQNKADLDESGKVPSDQLPEMNYAPASHAAQHASGGTDSITPASIGAAASNHTHTPASIGAAQTVTLTCTVPVSWTASGSYYYQQVSVSGMLASDNPVADILPGSDNDANKLYAEAWGKVQSIDTLAGAVGIWCTEAPTVAFPVQFKVVR